MTLSMPARRLLAGTGVLLAVSCGKTDGGLSPGASATAAPAPTPATAAMSPDAEATDVARTIRAFYPLACASQNAQSLQGKCQDGVRDYAGALKCAVDAEQIADATKDRLVSPASVTACGKQIEQSVVAFVNGSSTYFAAWRAWFVSKKAKIASPLMGKTLDDFCTGRDDDLCDGQPFVGDVAYEDANIARLNTIECTKRIFQCDPPQGNECGIQRVAHRLGVDCSPSENHDSALYVRANGHPLAP